MEENWGIFALIKVCVCACSLKWTFCLLIFKSGKRHRRKIILTTFTSLRNLTSRPHPQTSSTFFHSFTYKESKVGFCSPPSHHNVIFQRHLYRQTRQIDRSIKTQLHHHLSPPQKCFRFHSISRNG